MESSTCWHCGHPAAESLFCEYCNSLQRPTPDYYRFLGIDKKLHIDPKTLQDRFYQMSRKLHPDLFQLHPATERQNSLEATAILNDAYRVLRDPVTRAEYILKDNGFEIGEQRSKDVPPELLEEVFELNMALEEMRSGDTSARAQLVEAQEKFKGLLADVDSGLEQLFVKFDSGEDQAVLGEIRGVLNRRRYIRNLVNEVEKELTAPGEAR